MRALSIRQPWAWLIVHGHKHLENRSWAARCRVRGRVLIHASRTLDRHGWILPRNLGIELPGPREIFRGGIIGAATIEGVCTDSESIWFEGPSALCLIEPEAFKELIPWRGSLGFFHVDLPK